MVLSRLWARLSTMFACCGRTMGCGVSEDDGLTDDGLTDDGPPAKARITELEDRAPERAALAAPDLRQISETHGLLITPHHYPSAPAPMLQALSRLDDRLVEVLRSGDLRILRSAWLSQQPDTYRLQWRQELEKLDGQGASSALLSPEEAVALVQQCDRSVGALTHGAHPVCGSNPRLVGASTARSVWQVGCRRATLIRQVSVSKLCSRPLHRTSISRVCFGSKCPP